MKNLLYLSIILLLASCNNIDVVAEYNRGEKLYESQEYNEAIDAFSKIINETDTCLNCFLNRGHSYRFTNQPVKAREDYNQLIKAGNDTEIKVGYVNRGGTYYDESEYDSALSDYKMALKYDPNNGLILNMISHMCFATKDKESGCYYYWESIKYMETEFNSEIPEYCDSLSIESKQ